MGKTKTAILTNEPVVNKTSAELYAEKKAKKIAAMKKETPKKEVIKQAEIIEEETPTLVVETKSTPVKERVRGKKYIESKAKITKATLYSLEDAIKLVKDISSIKFDGTFEMHLVTKKVGITAQVTLPFSTGKQKKVEIADDKTVEKLKAGKVDFDLLLATAEMMPKLVVFAKLLGPKGLMPNPKNGTIIKSLKDAEKFKGNMITIKTEREAPLIHTSFGKISQKNEELVKNAEAIILSLGGSKAIMRAFIKSTMSPSVKIVI
jgi:large subunit ribosomal protein L1